MSTVLVASHAAAASFSLTVGGWQLWRSDKGSPTHRLVGRAWVVAMYWTVISSFFIRRVNPGHFSWLHGLSLFTFCTLTIGVVAAVRGDIARHRGYLTGSYVGLVGAFVGAVVVPQRAIPQLALHHPLVLAVVVVGVVALATGTIVACRRTTTSHPVTHASRSLQRG